MRTLAMIEVDCRFRERTTETDNRAQTQRNIETDRQKDRNIIHTSKQTYRQIDRKSLN